MKLIIAGSRHITDTQLVECGLRVVGKKAGTVSVVICGMAEGVDKCGYKLAKLADKPVIECPANWDKYGKAAGPKRNQQMADLADHLLLVWDGKSAGSKNMRDTWLTGHPESTLTEIVVK